MKKFCFLLTGVLILWTVAFVTADESKEAGALTGSIAPDPMNNSVTLTVEATTWDTAETNTWTTAEVITWDTADINTWTTGEISTWDTVEVTTWDTAEITTWDTLETTETTNLDTTGQPNKSSVTIPESAKVKYDEEQIAAYEWAFNKGITTISNIEDARLENWLTRAELAKMMSQYMTNVLWETPAVGEVEYSDVDESLWDLVEFIKIAYAYKIMWINADGTPLEEFNPNGIVTRAEYATVFSRVLYWDNYNRYEWNYYEGHLIALKEAGILKNINPTIQEMRWWVMLMMYRSTNPTAEKTEEWEVEEWTGEVVWIANPASEYCVAQWWTVNIVKDAEWNESGMCKLADGTEIDEREYYRSNNSENETWDTVQETEPVNWSWVIASGSNITISVTPNA